MRKATECLGKLNFNNKKCMITGMRNIEKCIIAKMLATLRLEKARQEYDNEYVFGFDDVERILNFQIEVLGDIVPKEEPQSPHGDLADKEGAVNTKVWQYL